MSNGDWKQQCYQTAIEKGWPICNWENHCVKVQSSIDSYCSGTERVPGTPVVQLCVPGVDTDCYEDQCWCCCSCFAYDTPIETSPGNFAFIQNIEAGDKVMTTGLDLKWKETEVQYSSGLGPNLKFPFMYYLAYRCEGEEDNREMITTADHLYLMASGKLKPIQNIIPGNKLRKADGKVAEVVFCVAGEYVGGVHHIHTGPFDGKNLNNHLINANGLICADYMVQLAYSSNKVDSKFLTDPPKDGPALEVGTSSYHSRFVNPEAENFLNNSDLWPPGLKPCKPDMINVPATAHSFFTKAQAKDIMNNASHSGPGYGMRLETVKYLFKIYSSFYPDIVYLFDWNNDLPNAYAWDNYGQNIVLLTGGLVRVIGLNQEGLAVILSHLISVHMGKECIGEADYEGIFLVLRETWNDELFMKMYSPGIKQIEILFSFVSEKNSGENPDAICLQPSLKCRLQTYKAAASMYPIPECAVPKPISFEVVGAIPTRDLKAVIVLYNYPVNPPTAETKANYSITPDVKVDSAKVNPTDPKKVRLSVGALKPDTDYQLKVKDVLSHKGTELNPKMTTVSFRTEKVVVVNVGIRKAKK